MNGFSETLRAYVKRWTPQQGIPRFSPITGVCIPTRGLTLRKTLKPSRLKTSWCRSPFSHRKSLKFFGKLMKWRNKGNVGINPWLTQRRRRSQEIPRLFSNANLTTCINKKIDLEIKRKEEEYKAMKECTGKPKINERSKRIKMSNISQLVKPRANHHNLCKGKKFKRTKNDNSSKRKPPTGRNTPNGITLIESPGRAQPAAEITPRSILWTPQSDFLDGFTQNDGQLSMNCISNQNYPKEGEESLVQYAKSPNSKPKKVSFGFVKCSSTPQIEVKP